jgi:hypothetical protein
MFRNQACYPETSQADGCFPENDATPSRFKCFAAPTPASLLKPRERTRPEPKRSGKRAKR